MHLGRVEPGLVRHQNCPGGSGFRDRRRMIGQILVVDDDPRCRALVAEEAPALVVLDVNLPSVSGYEVCRRLRDRNGTGLPIVFLSGERVESFNRVPGF